MLLYLSAHRLRITRGVASFCNIEHSVRRGLLTHCGGAAVLLVEPPSVLAAGVPFCYRRFDFTLEYCIKENGIIEPLEHFIYFTLDNAVFVLFIPFSF
jgi:hypothetical protein